MYQLRDSSRYVPSYDSHVHVLQGLLILTPISLKGLPEVAPFIIWLKTCLQDGLKDGLPQLGLLQVVLGPDLFPLLFQSSSYWRFEGS